MKEPAEGNKAIVNDILLITKKITKLMKLIIKTLFTFFLSVQFFQTAFSQSGIKHSLNVATTAGIVLWECYRQFRLRRFLSPES